MVDSPNSKLLRIFVGETDKVEHEPLYERIVYEAKKHELGGATVIRGMMSYGATSRIHKNKMVAISEDMPMIIEIVDVESKINDFLETLKELFDQAGCGGLITMEKMNVIHYEPENKDN